MGAVLAVLLTRIAVMMLAACLVATNGVAQQVHSWTEHWSGSSLPHDCHASVDDTIGLIEVFRPVPVLQGRLGS